jgi:hypothetical protein
VWFGFTQRQAVFFLDLIAITLGISGILLRNTTSVLDSQLALFQGMAIVAIILILMALAARRHAATLEAHEAAYEGLARQLEASNKVAGDSDDIPQGRR